MIAPALAWSETLWRLLPSHLWQSTLALAVIAIAARGLRDAPARWPAALWLAASLKLMLPMALVAPLTATLVSRPATWMEPGAAGLGRLTAAWLYPELLEPVRDSATAGAAWLALSLVWVAVAGLLAGRSLLAAVHSRQLAARGGPEALAATERERLLGPAARAGLDPHALVVIDGARLPSVVGFVRPRVVLPRRLLAELDDEELDAVLLHEAWHRRRRDPLQALVVSLVAAVWFFYPPVWWIGRRMRQAAELACDERVLASGIDPERYRRLIARLLLRQLELAGTGASLGGPRPSFLQGRLRRLAPPGRFAMTRRHRLLLAAAVAVLAGATLLPLSPAGSPFGPAAERGFQRLAEADLPVQLGFEKADVRRILDALSDASGVSFRIEKPFSPAPVTISTGRVPLAEALARLAELALLDFRVIDERTIGVRSHTVLAGISGVTNPIALEDSRTHPIYPEAARADRLAAKVVLQARIDELGEVSDVQVLSSSRPEVPEFAENAVAAVSQWRYEPATLEGEPVPVYFTVVIEYTTK